MEDRFEDYLITKNDGIYNAAYQLACAIASKDAYPNKDELEWSMHYIGEIVEAAKSALNSAGIRCCHPYYEGEERTPCYRGEDCEVTGCPFKSCFDIDTARRGQEITQEQYDHYLNVYPPISLKGGQDYGAGFQLGEPYSHEKDTRTGRLRPVYATFTNSGEQYFYQGINFAGEVDSRQHMESCPEDRGASQ